MTRSQAYLLSFSLPDIGITDILDLQVAQWKSMQKAGLIDQFCVERKQRTAWVICSEATPEDIYVRMLEWPIRLIGLPEIEVLEGRPGVIHQPAASIHLN